jgi:hypothetical protein
LTGIITQFGKRIETHLPVIFFLNEQDCCWNLLIMIESNSWGHLTDPLGSCFHNTLL